jgi:ribonuclease HI
MASIPSNPDTAHPLVELFTDGSCCHGNPGPGGWAFILRHSKSKIERVVSGGIGYTTNERMEMIAAINGLRSLKRPCRVTLYTDSKGVVSGITQRVAEWKQFGWRKSINSKKYVNNADLWMHLAKQCAKHTVEAKWVKGHAGHAENERCDKLARQEARKAIEHLEGSAEKAGAGADALLADWVSAAAPPPAAANGPPPKRPDGPKGGMRSNAAAQIAPAAPPATATKPPVPPRTAARVQPAPAKTMMLFPQPPAATPAAPPVPAADRPVVDLFTDGACAVNPGPGGWAFILRHRATRVEKTGSGRMAHTTNNRMEMMAVIQGLIALRRPCQVNLFTDSQYVARGISEWSAKWKKFGWRKTPNARLKILNADLWARLDELCAGHAVVPQWVRSHAGHPENEQCDQLAEREAYAAVQRPGDAPVDSIQAGDS